MTIDHQQHVLFTGLSNVTICFDTSSNTAFKFPSTYSCSLLDDTYLISGLNVNVNLCENESTKGFVSNISSCT